MQNLFNLLNHPTFRTEKKVGLLSKRKRGLSWSMYIISLWYTLTATRISAAPEDAAPDWKTSYWRIKKFLKRKKINFFKILEGKISILLTKLRKFKESVWRNFWSTVYLSNKFNPSELLNLYIKIVLQIIANIHMYSTVYYSIGIHKAE